MNTISLKRLKQFEKFIDDVLVVAYELSNKYYKYAESLGLKDTDTFIFDFSQFDIDRCFIDVDRYEGSFLLVCDGTKNYFDFTDLIDENQIKKHIDDIYKMKINHENK